ncbi:unnamed protein product, partial [Gulo gulo]
VSIFSVSAFVSLSPFPSPLSFFSLPFSPFLPSITSPSHCFCPFVSSNGCESHMWPFWQLLHIQELIPTVNPHL